jgi:outer membrane protein assembly factor BamB
MPDSGESTPVIWGNRVFIQTAVPTAEAQAAEEKEPALAQNVTVLWRFGLLCLDRQTGKILWERTAREETPHEGHHTFASYSSFSPVTDGDYVWASFGSRGLHCYDLNGNHKWSADLVRMLAFKKMGEGGSPALAGDNVIVVQDHEGDSKISAFSKLTGELSWERDRDEGSTWATPLPVMANGSHQVITSAANFFRSYDAKTGDLVWQCGVKLKGIRDIFASPVGAAGRIYIADRKGNVMVIKHSGTFEVLATNTLEEGFDASPAIVGNELYLRGEHHLYCIAKQ